MVAPRQARPVSDPQNAKDRARTRPRVNIVLSPEARDAAWALAEERGVSLSQFVEQLIRAEVKRAARTRG